MMRSSFFLGLLGCLISANLSLADDSNDPHRDHERKRDDVRFECAFRGIHFKKEPIFCEAHGRVDGKVPHNHYITGDRDDRLIVTCGDRLIYDGDVVYGFFGGRDHHEGDDHDGNHDSNHDGNHDGEDRDRDHDRFFDLKLLTVTPFTAAITVENACIEGFDGGSDRAALTVTLWDRIPTTLWGSCHFRDEHRDHDRDHDHGPGPAPVVN